MRNARVMVAVAVVMAVSIGMVVAAGFAPTYRKSYTGSSAVYTNGDERAVTQINVISAKGQLAGTSIVCRVSNDSTATSIVFQTSTAVTSSTSYVVGSPCLRLVKGGRLLFDWGPTNGVIVEIESVPGY